MIVGVILFFVYSSTSTYFFFNAITFSNAACGVCHSDLHVMKGEIPFPIPCVVGHEITGEVVEHGPLTDRKTIERFCSRDDFKYSYYLDVTLQ